MQQVVQAVLEVLVKGDFQLPKDPKKTKKPRKSPKVPPTHVATPATSGATVPKQGFSHQPSGSEARGFPCYLGQHGF